MRAFVRPRQNVRLCGEAGVGKSHLDQAVGHRARVSGHTVVYTSADEMFRALRVCRADGRHDRTLVRSIGPNLLIIDDLGLRQLYHDDRPEPRRDPPPVGALDCSARTGGGNSPVSS